MVATNPLESVAQLQAIVAQLAPHVRPQVLPKGVSYGLDMLLDLCANDTQKKTLRAVVHKHQKPAMADATPRMPYVVGALDVVHKVFAVEAVQWLSQEEALVHEFPRFLELQLQDPDQASVILSTFLNVNGHAETDLAVAQQCFNSAFALQTLLRAFPRPQIAVAGRVVDVDATADIEALVAPLFSTSKKLKKKKTNDKGDIAQTQSSPGAKKKTKKRKSN